MKDKKEWHLDKMLNIARALDKADVPEEARWMFINDQWFKTMGKLGLLRDER